MDYTRQKKHQDDDDYDDDDDGCDDTIQLKILNFSFLLSVTTLGKFNCDFFQELL